MDVNAVDDVGCSPVYAATQYGHVKTIRTLHELRADINTVTFGGRTPVHIIAAEQGHEKVVKLLRKLAAKMDAESELVGNPTEAEMDTMRLKRN